MSNFLTFKPKAYEPEHGYSYQIFWRQYTREWEHLDYARDLIDLRFLLAEYRLAQSGEYGVLALPKQYRPDTPAHVTPLKSLIHSADYWDKCEVLSQGHTSNMVLDVKVIGDNSKNGGIRVFNSRMRKEDGAEFEREISVEVYNTFEYCWQEVFKYDASKIKDDARLAIFKGGECKPLFAYEVTGKDWFKRYFTGWRRIIGEL